MGTCIQRFSSEPEEVNITALEESALKRPEFVCAVAVLEALEPSRPQPQPETEPGPESSNRTDSVSSSAAVDGETVRVEPLGGASEAAQEEPVFQVGDWTFYGKMRVLHDSAGELANSAVRVGRARGPGGSEPVPVVVKSIGKDADSVSIEMFKRECEILQELGDGHPHILQLLCWAELPKEMVLLIDFAPDGDLSKHIAAGSCVPELSVRRLCRQLLSGLDHLHSRRIIHGDVKPQNVLLNKVGGAFVTRLADLGLATKVPEGQDSVLLGRVQGSHGYIPAEVIKRQEATFAVDLFALGVMVFSYLASYSPFYPASAVETKLEFDEACWGPVSPAGRAFSTQLLLPKPELRGTSGGLLRGHEWMIAGDAELVGEPRGNYAPQVLEIDFLDIQAPQKQFYDACAAGA